MRHLLSAACLLAAAGTASAQTAPAAHSPAADGWTFALSPYVWLPGLSTSIGTPRGTVDVDTSASDAVSDLNFALMGAAEARNGRWGLILDLIYSDISMSQSTPLGLLWEEGEVTTKLTAFTVYAGYRVLETDRASLDILGGGRLYRLDVDFSLSPGVAGGLDYDLSDDWANPVVGLRGRYAFNDKWYATALGDFGGLGADDSSWQAFASVGYQFNPTWSVQGGWRYMDVQRQIDNIDVDVSLNGPILGFTARF